MNAKVRLGPHRRRPLSGIWLRLAGAVLALILQGAGLMPLAAQTFNLSTAYRNLWLNTNNLASSPYSNYFGIWPDFALTNASTAVFGGSVLDNSTNPAAVLPVGGQFGLQSSSLGQPVTAVVADLAMGDRIIPPAGVITNRPPANFVARRAGDNTNAYYESTDPAGAAFWVPSTGQIIAAQPNNVVIDWLNLDGTTNRRSYNIGAVPSKRPARLFWTESPYDAPLVSLVGLFPVIHYNSEIRPPTGQIITNLNGTQEYYTTNITSGVWLDASKQLHAVNSSGMVIIEYYQTGTYTEQVQPVGIEIVQVLAPDVQVQNVSLGERLLPLDSYWGQTSGANGVIPRVTQGLGDTVTVYANQNSARYNWAFPLKPTWQEPWSLEVYWEQIGAMGVAWPYEVDWYSCDWPVHSQVFVIGDNSNIDQAPVLIPNSVSATVLPDMYPPQHAFISDSGRTFSSVSTGICLIQFTTQSNIWFDVVRTVSHTNAARFNLQPVEWPIATEITPGDPAAHALGLDGDEDYVDVAQGFLNRLGDWTVSLWFTADELRNASLYTENYPQVALRIDITTNGEVEVSSWNVASQQTSTGRTVGAGVRSNHWHYLTVTYANGTSSNGTLQVFLDDDYHYSINNFRMVDYGAVQGETLLGARGYGFGQRSNYFKGKLDEVRAWSAALQEQDIATNRYALRPPLRDKLVANFPCNEGQGAVVHNAAGDASGTYYGNQLWGYGQTLPYAIWDGFPGYLHVAAGNRYNPLHYRYPNETNTSPASHIFAVNEGTLEIWWANRSRNLDMPPVYYPSRVNRYRNTWAADPPEIVIASGLGVEGVQPPGIPMWDPTAAIAPSIYTQNDPSRTGYNPNEEHALILDDVAYALRNDLNTTNSSRPFVLLDYTDLTGYPRMQAFAVRTTNALYPFQASVTAGNPIIPIMPLAEFPASRKTTSDNLPPAWRDRKAGWWAVSAGDDGGASATVMHFYYPMQPGFYFPALSAAQQPPPGAELPWLPADPVNDITNGVPVGITYIVSWPQNVPLLRLGQTLTDAVNGLPDVWDQLSVDKVYEQSVRLGGPDFVSADLFDPVVLHGVDLDPTVINAMIAIQQARVDPTTGLIWFPNLAPSLYPRIYYDPNRGARGELVLQGQKEDTLTGSGFLLLNKLEDFEVPLVLAQLPSNDPNYPGWSSAVSQLPKSITPLVPNQPYVNAALGARLTNGHGYVTLAFNNSTNALQVPTGLPVSLSVLRVDTNLYSGDLEVIQPADVLAEQLSLRYSADFAGLVSQCEFRWRYIDPVGGLIPNTNFYSWLPYGNDVSPGLNEVTIEGASPFTLSDHYFAVQYRPLAATGPSGTNWSDWTYNLAPGWVVRAMSGVNPFEQIFQDMVNNPVDTRLTMISQAGGPYQGDIALNLEAASDAGLIPTYETIFRRAKSFSLDAGLTGDSSVNQTLLYAATRLQALYQLLGNEAYADAQDPTVAYPRSLTDANDVGANAMSIFPFMNQVPNVLQEELVLLRGRDGTLSPSVQTAPVYNRLLWNFTQGINDGEPAYAYNYNIAGDPNSTAGVMTAGDAKRLYPQGHGDAWGHYLSAISHYYEILAYPQFFWQTEPGATLVGNATVSTDFYDEQKFAATAAARARTGAQIVQLTYREQYSEDPTGAWTSYRDANTNRAWGVADWASRAGQAALYDWAVANSLLLDNVTNLTQYGGDQPNQAPVGIQKIDRLTTPELGEISANFREIQTQLDNAYSGLNPLGLAKDVVPFDIDPAAIDAGQTHFEQIYERALQAVYNAALAYDHARGASLALRDLFDSSQDLANSLAASETDYSGRLIDIYGTPFSDDIGPGGTYPQGYAGPDLVNWQVLDLANLLVNAPTGQVMQVQVYNLGFTAANREGEHTNDFGAWEELDYTNSPPNFAVQSNQIGTVSVYMANNGLRMKPPSWRGQRQAQGDLQLALQDYVQAWYALESKMRSYSQNLFEIATDIDHRRDDFDVVSEDWMRKDSNADAEKKTSDIVNGLKITRNGIAILGDFVRAGIFAGAGVLPESIAGFEGPFPVAEIKIEAAKSIVQELGVIAGFLADVTAEGLEIGSTGREMAQKGWDVDLEKLLDANANEQLLRWNTMDTLVKIQDQYSAQAELFGMVQALDQSYQRVQKLLGDGEALIFERAQVRARAAQRIQMGRYADIGYRIFRNDALRKYQAAFNLAARYTYLAAKAYDYETGLLAGDASKTAGSKFLADVVRARLPGRFYTWNGAPQVGGPTGEPGLADVLARMNADWDVAKGRFGFNNPDTETSRFSLRSELFRIVPDASGDAVWAQVLENHMVDDINQLPEYQRLCRPFGSPTNAEPALVFEFPTFIASGRNFFGFELAGGDNAYDSSHAVTKIRSVGTWFAGFNSTNGAPGAMANEPRVYLIPVGADVMRSPTARSDRLRYWTVFNQAIPLPFNVGQLDIDQPDWSPIVDSLPEPLAQVRRIASFRAYHDSGGLDPSEMVYNSRLVGRSVWNTRWMLIIPGRTLLADPGEGLQRFIYGAALPNGSRDGKGVKDIKIFFQTYSITGE